MTKSVPFRLVALVGLRGSGKTSLGRALAARLGWAFADGDDLLAAHTGRDAAKFLTEAGEPAFRAAERAVLVPFVAGAAQTVLATGGGAVLSDAVRGGLVATDVLTIWLVADLQVLAGRLVAAPGTRPPLTDLAPDRELSLLAERRLPLYREVADAVVDTGQLPLERCVELIQAWLRSGPPADAIR